MLPVRAKVICGGDHHNITLASDGRLIFHNHANITELRRHLSMGEIGGRVCLCARVWRAWQIGDCDRLPKPLVPYRKAQVNDPLFQRLVRKLNARRTASGYEVIEQRLHELAELPQVGTPSEYSKLFVNVLTTQLLARLPWHTEVVVEGSGTVVRSIGTVNISAAIEFPNNNALIGKFILPAGSIPQEIAVVRGKNDRRALTLVVDELERIYRHKTADQCEERLRVKSWEDAERSVSLYTSRFFNAAATLRERPGVYVGMSQSLPALTTAAAILVMKRLENVSELVVKLTGHERSRTAAGSDTADVYAGKEIK